MNLTLKDVWRFAQYVKVGKPNECWEWTGGLNKGYGRLSVYGRRIYAHRISYVIHKGSIPEGLFVCHACDNPKCCNPRHLWVGTAYDNNEDRLKKGRSHKAPGTTNHAAKLNDDSVREIRRSNETCVALARRFGVSDMVVSLVRRRKRWAHVAD